LLFFVTNISRLVEVGLGSLAETSAKWKSSNASNDENDACDKSNSGNTVILAILIVESFDAALLRQSIFDGLRDVEQTFCAESGALVRILNLLEEFVAFILEQLLCLLHAI